MYLIIFLSGEAQVQIHLVSISVSKFESNAKALAISAVVEMKTENK